MREKQKKDDTVTEETEQAAIAKNLAAVKSVGMAEDGSALLVTANLDAMDAYKMGEAPSEGKWFPVLVGFVDSDGTGAAADVVTTGNSEYGIEAADKSDVEAFGGTLGTDVVLWLNANEDKLERTLSFKNGADGPEQSFDIVISDTEPLTMNVTKAQSNPSTMMGDDLTSYQANMAQVESVAYDAEKGEITVNADVDGMQAYQGGAGEKKYYALVMEFAGEVENITAENGYGINSEDKADAAEFYDGDAAGKGLVVFWLNAADAERTFTLTRDGKTQNITVKVVDTQGVLNIAGPKKPTKLETITDADEKAKAEANLAAVKRLELDGSAVTITADLQAMEAYQMGGAPSSAKWFPILLGFIGKADVGVAENIKTTADSDYKINQVDKDDAAAFGGEQGKDIVLWLNGSNLERSMECVDTVSNAKKSLSIRIFDLADYSGLDAAIEAAKEYEEAAGNYANYDVLADAVQAAETLAAARDRNTEEQSVVDAAAQAVADAIAGLALKGADYSKVDAAIAKANALNPAHYTNFTAVQAAVKAVTTQSGHHKAGAGRRLCGGNCRAGAEGCGLQ